tara:strand:+ start:7898 stop:8395 length:498 start_codon:yes stop_codon:yes gene_type:complete
MHEETLYNKILLLSRNKLFYTKFDLTDSFQNRINLIFMHISFVFIKIKQNNHNESSSEFYQKMFDLIFKKIELNMREIGYGDVAVNKNMKFLVKVFYSILLYCEKYQDKTLNSKNKFFTKHLTSNLLKNSPNKLGLVDYFDKYKAFCFDLSSDSVLSGDLSFIYK